MIPLLLASPLMRRIGLAVAIVLAAAWFVRHETTKAFEAGQAQGITKGWKQAEEQNQKTWDAEAAKLQEDANRLSEIDKDLRLQRAELERGRRSMNATLNQALSTITVKNQEERMNVSTLNSPELVPTILSTLQELDSIQRERDARPAGPIARR
jgi:hypothetical protein